MGKFIGAGNYLVLGMLISKLYYVEEIPQSGLLAIAFLMSINAIVGTILLVRN